MAKLTTKLLPPGQYWVGDLCYVMNPEWNEICSIICSDDFNDRTATIELDDGRLIALSTTAYGDGIYPDNYGNTYGVDAGLIGVIKVEDIKDTNGHNSLGTIHNFTKDFIIGYNNGDIMFDHLVINTGDCEYEDELDYDYYDEDDL